MAVENDSRAIVQVDLFSTLDATGVTIFYDSVCGIPLFRAPVGRTFEAWQAEHEGGTVI